LSLRSFGSNIDDILDQILYLPEVGNGDDDVLEILYDISVVEAMQTLEVLIIEEVYELTDY